MLSHKWEHGSTLIGTCAFVSLLFLGGGGICGSHQKRVVWSYMSIMYYSIHNTYRKS